MRRELISGVLLSTLLPMAATAELAEPRPVQARLVSDRSTLEAGVSLLVGVELTVAPGWHIYWRNPGDAGLATAVRFWLPSDFEVGDLAWPLPERFTQPGDIVGYGYQGSVILASPVRVPEPLPVSGSLPVRAHASWLACKDICVLGEAVLNGELPSPAAGSHFAGWRQSLPVTAEAARLPFTVLASRGRGPDDLTVWLRWAEAPVGVELFPDPAEGLKVTAAPARTRGNLTRIDLTVKRTAVASTASTPETALRTVVVITDQRGARRGFEVPVELD